MKSAGKARSNGLYRHIRTSKEIIRNLLNDLMFKNNNEQKDHLPEFQSLSSVQESITNNFPSILSTF